MEKRPLSIVIDDREPKSLLEASEFCLRDPQFSHFNVTVERLPACDIICRTETKIGKTGIEIKRGEDFIASILDGRYPTQILNMRKAGVYDNLIFILVGNVEKTFVTSKFNPSAYYGALGSLQTKYRVSVNFVPDDFHAILLSFYIFKHSDLTPRITPVFRVKVDKQQRQIAMLSCIKGIGEISTEKILIEYTIPQLALIEDPGVIIEKCDVRRSAANAVVDFFHGRE